MIIPRWWTAQCFPQCKRDFKAGEGEKGEKETSEGRSRWPQGKKILQGQCPWLLGEEKTEPTALKSPLSIVCECAGGISALSLKLSCQNSFRGSFSSCCDSSTSVWKDIPGTFDRCWYFLLVGQIIYGNKHDTLLEIKAGGAVDSYQIDTHTNLWYGQEAY